MALFYSNFFTLEFLLLFVCACARDIMVVLSYCSQVGKEDCLKKTLHSLPIFTVSSTLALEWGHYRYKSQLGYSSAVW